MQSRILTTDRAIGDAWLVTGGLKEGDRLIVSGVQMAQPGMQVTASEAKLRHDSVASAEPLADAKPAAQ